MTNHTKPEFHVSRADLNEVATAAKFLDRAYNDLDQAIRECVNPDRFLTTLWHARSNRSARHRRVSDMLDHVHSIQTRIGFECIAPDAQEDARKHAKKAEFWEQESRKAWERHEARREAS